MNLCYDGWCRRIDLNFRAEYPYYSTSIYKIKEFDYQLHVKNEVKNFEELSKKFDYSINFTCTPLKLVQKEPELYEKIISPISDENIVSNFEGFPFTIYQLINHISAIHPDLTIGDVEEDFKNHKIIIKLVGTIDSIQKGNLVNSLNKLGNPSTFEVTDGSNKPKSLDLKNEVFFIASSKFKQNINCEFIERDEELWYKNINNVYKGEFTKDDLKLTRFCRHSVYRKRLEFYRG